MTTEQWPRFVLIPLEEYDDLIEQRRFAKAVDNHGKLMDENELADKLSVSVSTIRMWRYETDDGPPVLKVGRSIRYDPEMVKQWLAGRRSLNAERTT